jgi:transposase-like protein
MSDKIIHLNEGAIKLELKELVRNSVEETLNELLEQEALELTNAGRYERTEERQGYRSGHYERNLTTTSGDVKLKMPKLKGLTFETAIIERYRRRESSVEEALIEMYLAGVSVRRVEDITEALWGTKVSAGTVSNLNKKVYGHIDTWRNRPLKGNYPYVYVDGIYLKRNWGYVSLNEEIYITECWQIYIADFYANIVFLRILGRVRITSEILYTTRSS